jgi:nitrogen fixation-related uncharacterized protein
MPHQTKKVLCSLLWGPRVAAWDVLHAKIIQIYFVLHVQHKCITYTWIKVLIKLFFLLNGKRIFPKWRTIVLEIFVIRTFFLWGSNSDQIFPKWRTIVLEIFVIRTFFLWGSNSDFKVITHLNMSVYSYLRTANQNIKWISSLLWLDFEVRVQQSYSKV